VATDSSGTATVWRHVRPQMSLCVCSTACSWWHVNNTKLLFAAGSSLTPELSAEISRTRLCHRHEVRQLEHLSIMRVRSNRCGPQANIVQFACLISHAPPPPWQPHSAWKISMTWERKKTLSPTAKMGHSIPYSSLYSFCATGAVYPGWPRFGFRHGRKFSSSSRPDRLYLPSPPPSAA
jgi:hypothetical protein